MRRLSLPFAFPLAVALVCLARRAEADPQADAAKLFEQGRVLLAQGRMAEACARLDESMRLAPNGGTLLNLADCYEKNGQTASAYRRFREAAERAQAAGQKKPQASAEARMKALEATLARLTIHLAADSAPGTKVALDGEPAAVDESIPIDPGSHAIVASAEGREPATRAVQVPRTAAILEIEMPVLRPLAAGTTPSTSPPPTKKQDEQSKREEPAASGGGFTTLRWAGIGVAAVGVVAIGVGTVFGLSAKSKNDDAAAQCAGGDPNRCTPASVALTDDAKSAASQSTVLFVVGGAALVGGAMLFILGKESGPTSAAARFLGDGLSYRF